MKSLATLYSPNKKGYSYIPFPVISLMEGLK
jgi:hypothetical protein